mmetsp:Transcript_30170/g.65190  ORF Transcript_30170/g.65190 Transcript_30170/m.65190 type:complete len:372 (-) Transcript_30170:258-1373(-)
MVAASSSSTAAPAAVPLDSWMGCLPSTSRRNLTICDLALPAAHNSGARQIHCVPPSVLQNHIGRRFSNSSVVHAVVKPFASQIAVCQSLTITGLLNAGIRVLDFRVAIHAEKVYLSHSAICDITLEQGLAEASAFLVTHPTEVLVILITRDWDHRHYFDSPEHWANVQQIVKKVLGPHVAQSEPEALRSPLEKLCSLQRRAVIMLDIPKRFEVTVGVRKSDNNLKKSWKDSTRSVESMVDVLKEWRSNGSMLPERGCLKFLEIALPGLPRWHATAGNAAFRSWLGGDTLSIGVMLDFPDEETIRAIVARNWPPETPIAVLGKPFSLEANLSTAATAATTTAATTTTAAQRSEVPSGNVPHNEDGQALYIQT